ncbi:MAG: hypothetical protein K6G11_08460, partial [Lachnospiraceae bacterium]|nr:hypothetical protein [Lachnospiraceae bacterium]
IYGEEIKKTDIYKNIVKSGNTNELITNLRDSVKYTKLGLFQFDNAVLKKEAEELKTAAKAKNRNESEIQIENDENKVTLTDAAKEYNEFAEGKLEDQLRENKKSVDEVILKHFEEEVQNYSIPSFNKNGLIANAAFIKGLVRDIKAVNKYTSSRNFDKMKDELNRLDKYATKLASTKGTIHLDEINEYKELVDSVSDLAQHYLDNKKNINSDYAKSRVQAVGNLKRKLLAHQVGFQKSYNEIDKFYQKKANDYVNKNVIKYNYAGEASKKIYWGDYTTKTLPSTRFSLSRSAGVSIATFALANEGYDFMDLMEPEKYADLKREMFDKVAKKMGSNKPEDRKWLAETMYNGFKKYEQFMNDNIKNIDLDKPNLLDDEKFCKITDLSMMSFDMWQEIKHVEPEMRDLVAEKEPNTTYENYFDRIDLIHGYFSKIGADMSKVKELTVQFISDKEPSNDTVNSLAANSCKLHFHLEFVKNILNNNKDAKYSDLCTRDRHGEMAMLGDSIEVSKRAIGESFRDDCESTKNLLDKLQDGSIFENATSEKNPATGIYEISDLPDEDKIKELGEINKITKKGAKALAKIKKGEYDKHAVKEYYNDITYIAATQIYRKLGGLPVNAKKNIKISLETIRKRLFDSSDFKKSLISTNNKNKFMNQNSVYKKFTNEKEIEKLIAKHVPEAPKKVGPVAGKPVA